MKKLASLLLATTLLAGTVACSPATPSASKAPEASKAPAPTASAAAPAPAAGDLKMAVMLSGPPTDGGYCQQGKEALEAVAAKYGFEPTVLEVTGNENVKAEAENLAAEGYKVVFGQGGEYTAPFAEVAKDYPNTWFVTNGGDIVGPNQFPMCMSTEEGGYVCGVIAGMMSKTGKLGKIAGADFPSFTKPGIGMELGAKSVNPNIEVSASVLQATNSNEAYETAMNQIKGGADFIFANANEGTTGAIKAVTESEGVYGFGVFGDYTASSPEKIVCNSMVDANKAYITAADAIMNGTVKPNEIMYMGIKEGVIFIRWNDAVKATLPAEVVAAADKAIEDIIAGKIDIPNEYEIAEQGLK